MSDAGSLEMAPTESWRFFFFVCYNNKQLEEVAGEERRVSLSLSLSVCVCVCVCVI